MLYAAVRKRSLLQGLSVVGYTIAAGVAFATVDGDTSVEDDLSSVAMVINMLVGFGHALAIRRWTFETESAIAAPSLIDRQREAVDMHSEHQIARAEARKIVNRDPDLARSLHIGRADLPDRTFPDGGLVDVNSVPVNSLSEVTGLPVDLAERIVEARRTMVGGFVSVADLSVGLNLPPHALDHLDDVLIFLPPTDQPFLRP